jgi:hypothetical protein
MKIICASVGLLIVLSSLSSVSSAVRRDRTATTPGQPTKTIAGDQEQQ